MLHLRVKEPLMAILPQVEHGFPIKRLHINDLELKAISLALQVFIKTKNEHVKIMCDNTTAISCINKMGTSHPMDCNYLIVIIWEWAMKSNIQLTAAHIPGKQKTSLQIENLGFVMLIRNGCSPLGICINP